MIKPKGEQGIKLKSLDLCITNRCNYRCAHCGFDSGCFETKELSLAKIKEVLVDAKLLSTEKVDISGGEPLLREDVYEIIKFGKKLGFRIKLLTNGSLLSDDVLKRLKKIGLDDIGVSLDGSTPEVYNKIRRKNKIVFNKVISNIKKCVSYGFYTKVNTVLFKFNLKDIVNIVRLCNRLGVNELRVCYFIPFGRGSLIKNEFVNPLNWLYTVRNQLTKLKTKTKLFFGAMAIENNKIKTKHSCLLLNINHLHIMSDGEVYPCPILSIYKKSLGNLNITTLTQILADKTCLRKYLGSVKKLFRTYTSCLPSCFSDYPGFSFVCPYKKFSIEDLK